MIILAHDGSIYNDWVARYAMRFASVEEDRKLLVLHVRDGKVNPEIVSNRFLRLAKECTDIGVDFNAEDISPGKSVYRSLRQAVPLDPESLLICGTRVKPRRHQYLSGSIAEKLLRTHQCPVLALRVVQPGLLGNPHDLFLPLAGHIHGFSRIEPIVYRLAHSLRAVHLFRAMQVNPWRHPHLSLDKEKLLKNIGTAYLERFKEEMVAALGFLPFRCDRQVSIASDWANEVLVQASRLKAQLMLVGLSERSLAYKVFHSTDVERILHESPCDVGIYRGP